MAHPMRIDVLRSVAEAAGLTMAPEADQFDGDPLEGDNGGLIVNIGSQVQATSMDGGNYSRSWARPTFRDSFPEAPRRANAISVWLTSRRTRIIST